MTKFKAMTLSVLLVSTAPAYAGYPCPPDSCNISNGCTDGCSSEQLTCDQTSESQCVGASFSTPCHWSVGHDSGPGYCYPNTSDRETQCSCG
jgi:hypothetical protein